MVTSVEDDCKPNVLVNKSPTHIRAIPKEGREILTIEPSRGVIKDPTEVINRAVHL
jgi:hypothetical protein